jgi:hypothetical protein
VLEGGHNPTPLLRLAFLSPLLLLLLLLGLHQVPGMLAALGAQEGVLLLQVHPLRLGVHWQAGLQGWQIGSAGRLLLRLLSMLSPLLLLLLLGDCAPPQPPPLCQTLRGVPG